MPKRFQRARGQQPGIARTRADEIDVAAGRPGVWARFPGGDLVGGWYLAGHGSRLRAGTRL